MKTINITAHIQDDAQIKALKAFMKALKIKFEASPAEKTYDPEFVKKIQKGDEDLKNGKGRKITLEELDNLWK